VTAFLDTNVVIRHLTGDPAEMAARASAYLATQTELLLTDLILAEVVYVLESFYRTPRPQVAEAARSLVAFDAVLCRDSALLIRAIDIYEVYRLDFAEAYLVASAESTGVRAVASFDQAIDRVESVTRIEP